jgi:hypothetical protein
MIDNAGLLAKVKWENRSNNIAIKTYIVTTECGKKKNCLVLLTILDQQGCPVFQILEQKDLFSLLEERFRHMFPLSSSRINWHKLPNWLST